MKSIVSAACWAIAMIAIALAAHNGMIARDDASNVILVLAVVSAIQFGVLPRGRCGPSARTKGCGQ